MLRAKETVFWTFLMPIVFFYFIGTITGGFASPSSGKKTPLVVETDPDAGFLAPHLERRLEEVGFKIDVPESVDPESKVTRLEIPKAFTDEVLEGGTSTITLTRRSGNLRSDYDDFRVNRAVYTVLGDVIAASEDGTRPTEEGLTIQAQAPEIVSLDVYPAGGRKKRFPTGFEQAIPGTTVMFTLLVLLTSGSVLLVIERRQGLLQRLASAPLSRRTVILGKWGGRMMIGLVQLGFAMLAGTVIFSMNWGPNLPTLVLVLVVYAGLIALLGMVLGSLARTEGQAVGIGVLAANLLAALGGCWWPIEITPDWMQRLALFLPTGWAMDALHKLVSFEAPPSSVIPHLVVMLLASIAAGWAATRTFRFQ
jgi:ABC-type multidrug transport system permease subunit